MDAAAQAIEATWRTHRFALVSALAARFRDLDLAEEALADAVAAAGEAWKDAVPERPEAWLYRTAQRKCLDRLRRHATANRKAEAVSLDRELHADPGADALPEARLGLFFHCAHPALAPGAQTALMLYHVAGLSTARIARAFLTHEATIQQRLKRARDKLKANAVSFEPPRCEDWPARLPPILSAVEIVYDQSYGDIGGGVEAEALGRDALQLAWTLASLLPQEAEVLALNAMLQLCESRRPARTRADGRLIPLSRQDPHHWDRKSLARAAKFMSAAADTLATSVLPAGAYTIRARIHATHGASIASGRPMHAELVDLHDALMAVAPSPVMAINRALALADRDGPRAGIAALEAVEADRDLSGFAPWHLARAELHQRLGEHGPARLHLTAARQLVPGTLERAFIGEKIALLEG